MSTKSLLKITAKKNYISIKELSKKLSISEATAKNWIKLNKIKPELIINKSAYFSKEYVKFLVNELNSQTSDKLKSRRNKKYISGSFFYKDYLSSDSVNLQTTEDLLKYITEQEIILSEDEIKYIIADCAIQLILQCKNNFKIEKNFLQEYLNKNIDFNSYNTFIDDLIKNKNEALKFIKNYSKIFQKHYVFEKNEDVLGLLYISLSNLGNRKALGAYYTPTNIVKKVIKKIDFTNGRILDPCCGSGNFLLQLPDNIDIKQIYGNDINPTSIKITRLNMILKYKINNIDILYKNFTNNDFLITENQIKFDYIIGNPPWGAEFSETAENLLRGKYLSAKGKNIESYDVFIEKSLSSLNKCGTLSFILPESILTVKNHQNIRKLILKENSIKYIEYLENMFDKVQCPSIILQLEHSQKPMSCIGLEVKYKNKHFIIDEERKLTSEVFSFSTDNDEYKIYEKIFNNKNIKYLKGNAIFALGIVTGDNKKYLSQTKTNHNEIVLKGSDIDKFKIKTPSNYIKFVPEKYQQVAPTQYYRAKEKLLYKFISKKLVFACDDKQTLTLNSCNILIPQIKDLDIKYIMAVLNSRISQFLFEKKYNSVKVLRSHIESLPIPLCDKEKQQEIINITNKIINTKNKNEELNLYENLENEISQLYKLNKKEYETIKKSLNYLAG